MAMEEANGRCREWAVDNVWPVDWSPLCRSHSHMVGHLFNFMCASFCLCRSISDCAFVVGLVTSICNWIVCGHMRWFFFLHKRGPFQRWRKTVWLNDLIATMELCLNLAVVSFFMNCSTTYSPLNYVMLDADFVQCKQLNPLNNQILFGKWERTPIKYFSYCLFLYLSTGIPYFSIHILLWMPQNMHKC